jgi:Fe-S oxidoreductase
VENLEEVLVTCSLCPGICISACPVYTTARIRSASPPSLARIALRHLREGADYIPIAFYCNYCRRCEKACPLHNRLAETLRALRKRAYKAVEIRLPKPSYVGGEGKRLLIVSPGNPSPHIVKVLTSEYSVYWLNTEQITKYYLNGFLNEDLIRKIIDEYPYVLSEDIDLVSLNPTSLNLLKKFVSKSTHLKAAVLHIPCKLDEEIARELIRILPIENLKTVNVCTGATLDKSAEKIVNLMFNTFKKLVKKDLPIITACRWSQTFLKKMGLPSYTLLDLLGGEGLA